MPSVPTGHNLRSVIAGTEMTELYAAQQLTIAQVAKYGLAPTTIRRRFKDLGMQARPRGLVPNRSSTEPIAWTADLAYTVGVIATDGNLARQPGGLSIVSNDVDWLEMFAAKTLTLAPLLSISLLRWMYPSLDVLCLARKRDIALPFLRPSELPRRRGTGRPMVL